MPTANEFIFDATDLASIQLATNAAGEINWTAPSIEGLKTHLKTHLRAVTNELCAYCQRSFHGEFPMLIDIEHVLPKGNFPTLTFEPQNLSVACKRCNLFAKGRKWNFFNGRTITDALLHWEEGSNYQIIHPNLDVAEDHLTLFLVQRGKARLLFYVKQPDSAKGAFTFDFFQLERLKISAIDAAQGIVVNESQIEAEVNEIFERLNA